MAKDNHTPADVTPAVLPTGFTKVSDAQLPDDLVLEPGEAVTARVLRMDELEIRELRGTRIQRYAIVDTALGERTLWQSSNLRDLFDQMVIGCEVFLAYTGDIDLGNGRNPMKGYTSGIRYPEGTDHGPTATG